MKYDPNDELNSASSYSSADISEQDEDDNDISQLSSDYADEASQSDKAENTSDDDNSGSSVTSSDDEDSYCYLDKGAAKLMLFDNEKFSSLQYNDVLEYIKSLRYASSERSLCRAEELLDRQLKLQQDIKKKSVTLMKQYNLINAALHEKILDEEVEFEWRKYFYGMPIGDAQTVINSQDEELIPILNALHFISNNSDLENKLNEWKTYFSYAYDRALYKAKLWKFEAILMKNTIKAASEQENAFFNHSLALIEETEEYIKNNRASRCESIKLSKEAEEKSAAILPRKTHTESTMNKKIDRSLQQTEIFENQESGNRNNNFNSNKNHGVGTKSVETNVGKANDIFKELNFL